MVNNNSNKFKSVFSIMIVKYIDYMRSMSLESRTAEIRLAQFDKLAYERVTEGVGITKELADEWGKIRSNETPNNRYQRISLLRRFSSFLQLHGIDSYLPKLPKYDKNAFMPYIFTTKEITDIFRESDKLYVHRKYLNSSKFVMPTLIRILYSTGIRIGEALSLKHSNVNLCDGILTLYKCKNSEDRLVPLSLSMREICKDYVSYKERMNIKTEDDSFFFTSPCGNQCLRGSIADSFKIILQRARIHHNHNRVGVRLHDLRHTFCVHTLHRLCEQGLDLYYSMPILMTYIGHKSLSATNRYVRLTEEMYPGILKNVNKAYKHLFPEIELNNETNESD